MEVLSYYVTTIGNAFKNLAPYFAFIVGGYFIFVKMPFLFFRKSMDQQKVKAAEEEKKQAPKYSIEDYEAFKSRVNKKTEEKKKEEPKQERKQEKKPHVEKPRETFQGFRPEDKISKEALKKRYFELLKENHPDRVATMGPEFKKLAEKNTKEINDAYEKLKKKAA